MNHQISGFGTKADQKMDSEQFTQIVAAILEGKYSWACVLILRFAGYNPLNYIPYRTYNRLMKENCQSSRSSEHQRNSQTVTFPNNALGKSMAHDYRHATSRLTNFSSNSKKHCALR